MPCVPTTFLVATGFYMFVPLTPPVLVTSSITSLAQSLSVACGDIIPVATTLTVVGQAFDSS